MDLGRFERSRLLFWSWLIVPVALVLVTVAPSMLYLRRQREGLAQRQALLAKIPDLEALTPVSYAAASPGAAPLTVPGRSPRSRMFEQPTADAPVPARRPPEHRQAVGACTAP